MIKVTTLSRAGGPDWHLLVCPRPRDWFLGERAWPQDGRPVLMLRGLGPIQLRRFLTHDEAEVVAAASARVATR